MQTTGVDYALGFFRERRPIRGGAGGWFVHCPIHEERTPSLHVQEGDSGRVLMTCHGCGAGFAAVTDRLGMDRALLGPPKAKQAREVIEAYDYRGETGNLLYQVCRLPPDPDGRKVFAVRRPNGGGWLWNLGKVPKVLFNLPEVAAAIRDGRRVYLAEGEKDALTLEKWGLVGTTNVFGAKSWDAELAPSLAGAHVIILEDNDAAGRARTAAVSASLLGVAASLRLVRFVELPEHGDVTDWMRAGHTGEELEALASCAPVLSAPVSVAESPVRLNGAIHAEAAEPVTLPARSAAPFPVEVLPGPFRNLVIETAAALPCPPDFLALPMLTIAGAAIGTTREIEVKPGWREGPRVYSCVVADPGAKKSPALEEAMLPVKERQLELSSEYGRMETDYQEALAEYQSQLSEWQKAKKANRLYGAGERPEEPEAPRLPKLIATDATVEAMTLDLSENPRGLIYYRDELSGWTGSMNAYKGGVGADRQSYLQWWSGSLNVVSRKGDRRPIILGRPFINVTGCVPPDVLPDLTSPGGREDGFIHRILFAFPEPVPTLWTEACISGRTRCAYAQTLSALYRMAWEDREGRPEPAVLRFSRAAREVWVEWVSDHYRELTDRIGQASPLRGAWSKLDGYCARIALILHLSRQAAGETDCPDVDERSMVGAATLCEYLKSHIRRVYMRIRLSPEERQLESVIAWIEDRGGITSYRDLCRMNVAGVRTSADAALLVKTLTDRGYARTEPKARDRTEVHLTIRRLDGDEWEREE